MVLNRTDFGKCWKSSQTLSKVAYMLLKWNFICFGACWNRFRVNSTKGPKSTDFDKKAWANSPMVLNRTDFGKCWKSSQTLSKVAYMLPNGILTVLEFVRSDIG